MPYRRTFLAEPDDNLTVIPSPVQSGFNFQIWTEFTGISPEHVLISPTSSVPLPIYPDSWPDGLNRWPGTNPSAMWHPLMWLPDRLRMRYEITDDDSGVEIEDDVLWSIRVACELIASGLYNPEDGSWGDILSLVDIDADNADDQHRIQQWLDGGADETLDSIDLGEFLTSTDEYQQDPDWAIGVALREKETLLAVNWVKAAHELLDEFNEISEDLDGDIDSLRSAGSLLSNLAGVYFSPIEIDGEPDYNEASWWDSLSEEIRSFTGTFDGLVAGPVTAMTDRLEAIEAAYEPQFQEALQSA